MELEMDKNCLYGTEVKPSGAHFELEVLCLEGQVLGLGAPSPQKLPCPRLEYSTIIGLLKLCRWPEKCF